MSRLIEYAENQIIDTKYIYDDLLTICIITTSNGYKVIGESNVVNHMLFDKVKGMEISYQKAFNKLVEVCAFSYID